MKTPVADADDKSVYTYCIFIVGSQQGLHRKIGAGSKSGGRLWPIPVRRLMDFDLRKQTPRRQLLKASGWSALSFVNWLELRRFVRQVKSSQMNGSAMAETPIDREFSTELARIRLGEDVVPFLGQILAVSEVEFRPLPNDMRVLIQRSNDFVSIVPGAPSTWLHIEAEDANIALVIYRAGDGSYRVLAPLLKD